MMKRLVSAAWMLAVVPCVMAAPPAPKEAIPVARGKDGKLGYVTDEQGNRVPDFSYAGYAAGEKPIPTIPARLQVGAAAQDNTRQIQLAIDQLSQLPLDANGFRGAVLIPNGRYELSGGLTIVASGVVLRGSGFGDDGTTLVAMGQDRRTLVRIAGKPDRALSEMNVAVADPYVPVGAMQMRVKSPGEFRVGDSILIRRPSTKEWIAELHMDDLGGDRHGPSWRPGSRDILWDRTITHIDGDRITIDAPITCAIDAKFGGATVARYSWPGRISNVGVENMRMESAFDSANPKDEEHAWFAITIENAADAWVRQVISRHFVGSAVAAWDSCRRVTVEDCKSLEPIGEIGGWRRNAFFTSGQQVLMQRLYSEDGRHDFAVGFTAAGPNAFVQCESARSTGESGAIDSFACGTLFDMVRIDGNALSLRNRMYQAQGSGWAAANSALWNCSASVIECWRPPTAQNWAVGTWGEFSGDGLFYGSNDGVQPESLFYAQLADRIGTSEANERAQLLLPMGDASSSPSPQVAAELIARSKQPGPQMSLWIDQVAHRAPIPTNVEPSQTGSEPASHNTSGDKQHALKIEGGLLKIDDAVVAGRRHEAPWWNGGIRPADLEKSPLAITRYVPGRIGPGLTDDLNEVAVAMKKAGILAIEQHPPLWYDRRRDDHERIRRMDEDVVAPFYEHPFARTGQSGAWDGLSRYDLTKPNVWYWSRLRAFADVAVQNRLVLVSQHYFQHSILEAGAHYADYPWRPVNNINDTGFPEPPPFAGDKRIFMAEQFYDLGNEHRRELHRQYIRMNLDQLAGKTNVIHLIGDEYTGPLAFMQFWIDTIADWEKERNAKVIVGLSATKDVQDAILADEQRAKIVDVIDIRYWWYQADGKLYAPEGGKNLAPRQWERVLKPKNASAESIARAVREYREKFTDKAVIYSANGAEANGAAIMAAGGSMAATK